MTVMYEGLLDVHYGFFDVFAGVDPDGGLADTRRGQANGLCGARVDHRLSMVTGLHTGDVPLRVEWHQQAPGLDPEWEDVVEVSLEVLSRDGMLVSFEDGAELAFPHEGWHRARYCASGMDAGRDVDTTDEGEAAPDRYLLQLWPSSAAPDEVVKQSSDVAGYWHRVARGEAQYSSTAGAGSPGSS